MRRGRLIIDTRFYQSPAALSLTHWEFRRLINAAVYIAEWNECGVRPGELWSAAKVKRPQIQRFIDLGFLTDEGNVIRLAGPFSSDRNLAQQSTDNKGCTYLIQRGEDGPVKIGSTRKPVRERLAALQTAHDVKLELRGTIEGAAAESELHERFADRRLTGEWFEPSILAEIDPA